MSTQTVCNGCGRVLKPLPLSRLRGEREHVIHGERVNNVSGMGLPDAGKDFDWCGDCAQIAFEAVRTGHANS